MRRRSLRRALTPALLIVALSTPAQAGDAAETVEWRDEWTRFGVWHGVATGVALGGTLYFAFGTDFPDDGGRGGALFDEAMRDAFVADSRAGRDNARIVGDVLFRTMTLYPYVVDTLGAAWIGHGSPDVAGQMFLINTEAFAVAGLLSIGPEHLIGRARPSVEPCEADDEYEEFCNGADELASFPSGHTAIAATGAGLMCAHHQHLPLYGGGWGDLVACIGGISAAFATGAARLVNDRHWTTDIVTGALVGAASGYVLPITLHYGWAGSSPTTEARTWSIMPFASATSVGLGFAAVR